MEELIALIQALQASLKKEMSLLSELLPVLDEEESMLTFFMVPELERVVLEKDSIVRQVKLQEKKRLQNLQRICFLIGYDARKDLPNLTLLENLFGTYEASVANLLTENVKSTLQIAITGFKDTSALYIQFFAKTGPRITRNQKIMSKLAAGMAKSTKILLERSGFTQSYDAQGKTFTQVPSKLPLSSLKVKA
jgi:hypothetical protein